MQVMQKCKVPIIFDERCTEFEPIALQSTATSKGMAWSVASIFDEKFK